MTAQPKPLTMTQEREDSYRRLAEESGKRGAAVNVVVEGALAMLDELDAERAAHARTLDVLAGFRGVCTSNCSAFMGRRPCGTCRDNAEIEAHLKESAR